MPSKKKNEDSHTAAKAKKKVSMPYLLSIRNNTIDYIKGFSLSNLEQALGGKTADSRVSVEYLLSTTYTYTQFLQSMQNLQPTIGRIRIEAFHGYEAYQRRQLGAPIQYIKKTPQGTVLTCPCVVFMKLNQFIVTAAEHEVAFEFTDGWDLKFDLLPEASITIYLWPASEKVGLADEIEYREQETYLNQIVNLEKADDDVKEKTAKNGKEKKGKGKKKSKK